MGHSRPLFLYFNRFNTVDSKQMLIKDFQWMDSNHRSPVSEATALPTETQPLPYQNLFLRWHVLPVNLCFVYNGSPFVTKRNKLINEFCTYSRSDQIRLAYGECSLIKIKRNNVFLQNHLNHFFLTNALEQLAFMRGQVCLSCVCSVTSKKSPNVYKSCPKWFYHKNERFWTPLQKLSENIGNLGKIIVATGFDKLPKVHWNTQSGYTVNVFHLISCSKFPKKCVFCCKKWWRGEEKRNQNLANKSREEVK